MSKRLRIRRHSRPGLLLSLTVLVSGALTATAQETADSGRLKAEHILDWERVSDPQISPDAKRVVYARWHVNRLEDRWESELWIIDADGGRNRFLVKGSDPKWSPDGTRIAYIADGDPKGRQIFVRWMDDEGAVSQVTRLTETPRDVDWSPDTKWVSFTKIVPVKETWDLPSMPGPPEGASWTEAPRIVRKMHYRQDRVGFLAEGYRHLFVVPSEGGSERQLTEGAWHVGSRGAVGLDYGAGVDWTPDGSGLVFDGAMAPDADTTYRESHLFFVDLETKDIRQITSDRGPWASPSVSPDGRHIAFSGFAWTEQTYRVSDLYVIPFEGGEARNISSELDRDVAALTWAADSQTVFFQADDRGSRNLHAASLNGGVRPLTDGTQMLSLSSTSTNGSAVGTRTSFHAPADVVRFSLLDTGTVKDVVQLTHVNDDVLQGIELGAVEEIWYESTEGAKIQSWLVKPPDFDADRDYPLILHIHGGPHGMYNVGFNNAFQNYAANDYLLLYTNPRGSTGYGTDFGNAIDNGYPSVDHEDLMAGVDAVLKKGYADSDRLYVTGCSGGGVLSSWAIGHTNRFAAAAVRCPVTNWMSFAGTADINLWGYHRYKGYPWDNAEKYLEHSPLMHVGKVTTPTLLMTGELDLRTPMSQTEEYFQALKVLGVPTVMLRFNKEYHGTSRMPSNFIRTQLYIMDWFSQHTRSSGRATDESPVNP